MDTINTAGILKRVLRSCSSEKNTKREAERFFAYLGGGECPLEALQLSLGRNEELLNAQVTTVHEIARAVQYQDEAEQKYGLSNHWDFLTSLYHRNILHLMRRILKIRLPSDLTCDGDIPWKSVYFHCLMITKHIVDYLEPNTTYMKSIVESGTVEVLLEFMSGSIDLLASFPVLVTLRPLCFQSLEACERLIFCGGLTTLGNFMLKDNYHKQIFKQFHAGLMRYQLEALREVHDARPVVYAESMEENKVYVDRHPKEKTIPYVVLKKWCSKIQITSAHIIMKIGDQNDRHRYIIAKDPAISKALRKWAKTPAILEQDALMADACTYIISTLCLKEDLAWQMVESYDIVTCLGRGLRYPDFKLVKSHIGLAFVLSSHAERVREEVVKNLDLIKTLCALMFSSESAIQDATVNTIINVAESPLGSQKLLEAGLRPLHLTLLCSYYDIDFGPKVTLLRQKLKQHIGRDWTKEETVYSKNPLQVAKQHDGEEALNLKDAGNKKFKQGCYVEAIKIYTSALEVCPPMKRPVTRHQATAVWWVLPSVLYSNRAQCYINNRDWQSAADDCTRAIAGCLEDNFVARNILHKTVFRRAKALLELGEYHVALTDIAYCYRKDRSDDVKRLLFAEILAKYRKHVGYEPIRRCGHCMGGEGEKLKRCAKCLEVYCSRECQLAAWKSDHKIICNINRV
ncbi:uncharacterized protein LOC5514208 [Nematostella vectensis]|uniref:uncharacterized protein LOC5514208 n=1 Tax=Nematostella vectensis TaxID=45351 RepID=UPI00138FD567|nr:uncharacterized protein LOC5514208 [Nematostella vectensis]